MIGVDTNILARHVLQDDPIWSEAASRFLRDVCSPARPGYVNPVTLAELVWLLRQQPGYDRQKLVALIEALLADENLVVGSRSAVVAALDAFRQGPAGFADCLVAELDAEAGASPTYSIEKKALKHTRFAPLP